MTAPFTIIVPARLESTRLPRKLMLNQTGKPLIAHTLENLQPLRGVAELHLVTDSLSIADASKDLVDTTHLSKGIYDSGTSRICAISNTFTSDWIINVQADEPELNTSDLMALMDMIKEHPEVDMASLGAPFTCDETWSNPNAVKVLIGKDSMALYFSRAPVPYGGHHDHPGVLHHIGVYAYHKRLLQHWNSLEKGALEQTEQLEQLRALEGGIGILIKKVPCACKGIDSLEDYQSFVKRYNEKKQ